MALRGKRIFMTGGAGFMGTTLARLLVDDNEIVILDNLRRDALTGTPLAEHPNLRLERGSVLDPGLVTRLAAGATHIVHLAAIAGVDHVLRDPVETMRVNLIGTYNALEAADATRATIERFVDISTSEVFGARAYRVEETHDTPLGSVGEARWTYAVSKLAGEYLAHAHYDRSGLPATSVRPFNIYGPRQVARGAMMAFIEAAVAGQDLIIHGNGSQIRAWCYIDDMIEALLRVLERDEAVGQVFNVGNDRSILPVLDLANRVIRISGSSSRVVFRPLHYRDVEMRIPNVDKARRLLDWEASVDIDEGLERTIAWYREQRRDAAPTATR